MKPIIGITTDVLERTSVKTYGDLLKQYAEEAFTQAIWQAQGLPFQLPWVDSPEQAQELLMVIDGLLVIGGHDISPNLYEEEPHPAITAFLPDRDRSDLLLIDAAVQAKKPVLGICRGMQLLNVYQGGSLYQDLSTQYAGLKIQHQQDSPPHIATHTITWETSRQYFKGFTQAVSQVNSVHHQAIKDLGRDLKAVAYSKDGLIEAIESTQEDCKFFGTQWHPETLWQKNGDHLKVFEELVFLSR